MLDPESGLYYYGGRYYDPELGRFISPDPFVPYPSDPQSLNRYSYVVNNPVNLIDPSGYFHRHKKKGGFWRRFFGIFSTIVGILTLQPELAALGVASEAGISLVNIGIGLANLAGGIAALASGPGGLSVGGPPDFGLELGVAEFLGEFFSPALRLAAEAGCDFCPDSRLDLLRVLLGVFQPAEAGAEDAGAARNRVRKASERRPLDADKQPRNPSAPEQSQPKCRPPGTGNSRLGEAFLRAGEALAAVGALETGEALIRSGLAAARMGPVGAAVGVPTAILGAAIGAGGLTLSADVISGGAVGIIPPLCQ